tara:strand:+ start:5850 stop:6011 length:162 start_codon:yes stop_codon:yes gene_type:complete
MKKKPFKELTSQNKKWIIRRLKKNETIPQIAKHFNCSIITINRVIEERFKIKN